MAKKESSAKLKKPFGRQIAKMKAMARHANPGASNEVLAEAVNRLAKDNGFDYSISAEKMGGGVPKKRRGRRGRRRMAPASNGVAFTAPAPKIIKADPLEAALAVKNLVDKFGSATVKGLVDLLSK